MGRRVRAHSWHSEKETIRPRCEAVVEEGGARPTENYISEKMRAATVFYSALPFFSPHDGGYSRGIGPPGGLQDKRLP